MKTRILAWLPRWWPVSGWTPLPWFVFVKKGVRMGTIQHELVHTRQQRREHIGFYLKYAFWRPYRMQAEAEAYAVSAAHGESLDACAGFLAGPNYAWWFGFGHRPDRAECRQAILREWLKLYQ